MLIHPVISLNNIQVHLRLFLGDKLTFRHNINNTLCKVDKDIVIIKNEGMLEHENLYSPFTKYF